MHMKRFSFKLDTVLKYREHQERQAEMALGDARKACRQSMEKVDELVLQKKEISHRLQNHVREGVSASWYLTCHRFSSELETALESAREELKEKDRIVQERTEILKGQYVKKESLKTLRSASAAHHQKCMEIQEQKILDEMVLLRKGGPA